MPTELIMWGERGLVTTLLADLASCTDLGIWRSFFEQCLHGGSALPPFEIESVLAIIEPDFSNTGFGHPDAVFKLTFQDRSSSVYILEAKRNRYVPSCILPANRSGAGYNSQLNGQLELNHCLSLALADFNDQSPELIEPSWIINSDYRNERNGRRRLLKNPVVIGEVVKKLSGLSPQGYHHVVITTDTTDPFDDASNNSFWPELYTASSPNHNEFDALRGQFYWASWAQIAKFMASCSATARITPSLFLKTFRANQRNFKSGIGTLTDDAADGGPLDTRSARGASMIFAPEVAPYTFVHFSWQKDSARIRNYSRSAEIPPPVERWSRAEVVSHIQFEFSFRRDERRRVTDVRFWSDTTRKLNEQLRETELARNRLRAQEVE